MTLDELIEGTSVTGPGLLTRVSLALLAFVLFAAAGGMAAAVAADYAVRDIVPNGVRVADEPVGGLRASEARKRIIATVAEPHTQPVTVVFDGKSWEIDAAEFVHVDVDGMYAEVAEARLGSPITSRLRFDMLGERLDRVIEPRLSIDTDAIAEWVDSLASTIDTAPVDAAIDVEGGRLVVTPSVPGNEVKREAAVELIAEAALGQDRLVKLPVAVLAPDVSESEIGRNIVARLGERRLYLYNGADLEKTYTIAIGKPGHTTPRGRWTVTAKRYMPTWGNPGSAWAADMPRTIPPGPGNPLGTRAINLNASGIRIHGTTNVGSLGTAASHGCMRMANRDVEDLYERIEVGATVFVVQ